MIRKIGMMAVVMGVLILPVTAFAEENKGNPVGKFLEVTIDNSSVCK